MSESEDPRGAEFIQASVERDQPRVIDATQLTSAEPGQPPYPGAERVLKVTVPVEPDVTEDWKLHLPIDQDRSDEIDIDPCGYVKNEYLEDDELLQRMLIQTPTVDGPQVSGTGRQLLNIDLPKLLELRDEQGIDGELPEKNDLNRLRTLIDTHERDCETVGSHAHTLVNPQTRTVEVPLNTSRASIVTAGDSNEAMPRRSVIYNELCAMVAERLEHPDIAMRLGVDRYRRKTCGREYTLALEILEWLREHPVPERFSYQQISELLTAASHANHPVQFLVCALYDLASGMPLEDVFYNGQFFNLTNAHAPERLYNRKKELLKKREKISFARLHEQTVETVTFQRSSKEVVKEWWIQNPPAVYPLPIIRWILLHRNVAQFSQNEFDRSYIPSTVDRTGYDPDRTVGVGFWFQDTRSDLKHPYRLAMVGDDACKKAIRPANGNLHWKHKQKLVSRYVGQSSVFEGPTNMSRWFHGAAPTDMTTTEVVRWFQ